MRFKSVFSDPVASLMLLAAALGAYAGHFRIRGQ
jgi:hypothetical protein